jgi:NADPH2:quinone reductase
MVINQFGNSDVFVEMKLPKPSITAGHVVIKVMATSVNPFDCKARKGDFPDLIKSFPAVLHGDMAGIVEQIGEGVTNFAVGDEVFGCVGGLLNLSGALAEYVIADADLIAHKPKSLTFTQAAALPLVSLTAWQALITNANVQPKQTVLIHGGTGGVGHIAIQLAKWLGAKVFTTCSSASKMEIAKKLGADVAINYKNNDVKSYVVTQTNGAGFDVIFDTVGGDVLIDSITAAALYGKVISILAVGNYDLTPAFTKGLTLYLVIQILPLITGQGRALYGEILTKIAELVDAGIIKPLIDANQFAFHQVGAAHDHWENGLAVGKIVININ